MNFGQIRGVQYVGETGCGDLWDFSNNCRRCFSVGPGWNSGDVVAFDVLENGNAANLKAAIGVPVLRGNSRGNYGGVASVSSYVLQSELSAQELHEIKSIWAQNVPGGTL